VVLTFAVTGLVWSLYDTARLAAQGQLPTPIPSGVGFYRELHRHLNEFSIWLAQQFGPTSVLVLGGILVALCVGWVFREWAVREAED
jgi:hypothetical protein